MMKQITIWSVVAIALLISCNNNANNASTGAAQVVAEQKGQKYSVDTESSVLIWKGYHKGGLNPRFGTLKIAGVIFYDHDKLEGGSFTIDMNSVQTDKESIDLATSRGKTATDMDVHLKNHDFFDSEKYPVSKFDITFIQESPEKAGFFTISGNLTIKDKIVNVTFPSEVHIDENNITIKALFIINRKDWGLTYGAEGDPKDWLISKDVDIELNIKAKK